MTLRKTLGVSLALVFAAATLSAFQAKPVDVTGKWTGTLTPGGSGHLDLKQKGAELTGTAGPGPDQQLPISNAKIGTVKGVTTLTFDLAPPNNDGVMKFNLSVVEGRLKGTVVRERNGEKRESTADFGRAK